MNVQERIRHTIEANTGDDKPACEERTVRVSLVSHGDVNLGDYLDAGRALINDGEMLSGSGFVCLCESREHVTTAIPYVAEHADDHQEFVSNVNIWKARGDDFR